MRWMKTLFLPVALSCSMMMASTPFAAADPVADMVEAANNLLLTLTPDQREKATFAMTDEARYDWHFFPRDSAGLPFAEMTAEQRLWAHALVASALSQRGYINTLAIISLESVLYDLENQNPVRNPERYFICIFGEPCHESPWAWRLEGHHLNINVTVYGGRVIATTPMFFGASPARTLSGPREGLVVLGAEETLGLALVNSLDEAQREAAVFSETAPRDIITMVDRRVNKELTDGLLYANMNDDQQAMLLELLREYIDRFRAEVAAEVMDEIHEAGLDNIGFSWAGQMESGEPHYYRIQGPTFLIEYDNVQGNANHIHTVWRDFDGDYGEDILRRHYQQSLHH